MVKKIFGNRTGSPAYFDMSSKVFRIGDRAAAYVWLGDWRLRNPNRRLAVIEDNSLSGTEHGRYLPGSWLFEGIIDELWVVDRKKESAPRLSGENLYHVSLWRIWRWLAKNKTFIPTISPLLSAFETARVKLDELGVPEKFMTVHPLFDAEYDKFRNGGVSWWEGLCERFSREFSTVILGKESSAEKMRVSGKAYPIWKCRLNPMESMAVMFMARVHVGGMTGLTLWSAIFRVPTLAVYPVWQEHRNRGTDARPISFGAPVVWGLLGGDLDKLTGQTQELWEGRARSTPWS